MFLLQMIAEIPQCVTEQLKNSNNKVWYAKPYLYTALFFVALKEWYPYKRALVQIAYSKYTDTVMYRERLIHFGEDFAMKSFVDNREDKFFMHYITRREKFKAFFMPFNYIGRL